MSQRLISFRETVQDMIEVALEEIFMWEKFTLSLSMSVENKIHSFIAEASRLAQAMLTCLLFYDLILWH